MRCKNCKYISDISEKMNNGYCNKVFCRVFGVSYEKMCFELENYKEEDIEWIAIHAKDVII